MKNKMTAVEWLESHLIEYGFDLSLHKFEIQQAKEMEKQQIIDAYKQGQIFEGREQEVWLQSKQ